MSFNRSLVGEYVHGIVGWVPYIPVTSATRATHTVDGVLPFVSWHRSHDVTRLGSWLSEPRYWMPLMSFKALRAACFGAFIIVGCGGQIGDSDRVDQTTAAGTLPAPKDPQCERVLTFVSGLERSECPAVVSSTVDLTDEITCIQAGDDLDECYADGACRIDLGARLLSGCHGLVPYWPCIGSANYGQCLAVSP